MKYYAKANVAARQRWMAEFERLVNSAMPQTIGKIEWDSASNLFNRQLSARDAADMYVASRSQAAP